MSGRPDFDVERYRREKIRRLEREVEHLHAHRARLERIIALAVPLDVVAALERSVDADSRLEELLAAWLPEIVAEDAA